MKRIKLSNSLIIAKGLFIVFLMLFLMLIAHGFNPLIMLAGLFVFGTGYFQVFYLPDKIEFDSNKMYIVHRDGKREVNLGDIRRIATSRLSLNNSLHLVKIRYYYHGNELTARFYPRSFSKSLTEFKNMVKDKNPGARVEVD
jgi:hypothetical protein